MSTGGKPTVLDKLEKLVGIPTVTQTPNEALIRFLEKELDAMGFRTTVLESEFPGRMSLLASIGPETNNGIIFSAHSDVVSVEGQPWTSDPFRLTEREDGKLVGRGTSDMKGFIACVLVAAARASSIKDQLKDPLHIAISYDEEIGCVGVRSLLSYLKSIGFKARGCIIGEPTEMNLVTGHKGKQAVKVICKGLSGHSSNPDRGCNAILLANDMIHEVGALQQELRDEVKYHDTSYEVPFSTAQVGLISGGVALNIIPDHCEFQFEMRLLPSGDPNAYIERIEAAADKLLSSEKYKQGSITVELLNGYPGVETAEEDEFVELLKTVEATSQISPRINFGTEGGLFQKELNDIPVVVCGPGSIDRAHKADEWIGLSELEDGTRFLIGCVEKLTST